MRILSNSLMIGLSLAILVGCSTTSIRMDENIPVSAKMPSKNVFLDLGGVGFNDFRKGVAEELISHHNIKLLNQFDNKDSLDNFYVVSATLKEVPRDRFHEKTLRYLVGFGLYAMRLESSVVVKDMSGTTVLSFTAEESYNGGSGLGGLLDIPGIIASPVLLTPGFLITQGDYLDMKDLKYRLGKEVGRQIALLPGLNDKGK